MSMNFSEFKKLMGADPLNRDAETERARHSSPEFEALAAEAEAFEEKLQGALLFDPPEDLLDQVKSIGDQPARRKNWIPFALAASLLVFVGAAGLVWKQSHQWDSVEAYLMDHYSYDGSNVLARAGENFSDQDISRILAKLDARADEELSSVITFIKYCPTPDGRGAHMIVSTDQGPMTIIYMPETQATDGEVIQFDQMQASLVNLEHGSAAIIGRQSQNVENLVVMVRDSLKTGLVDA